jgi:hypothetical protein
MGSTLGPNSGPRARVILAHPNSFPFLGYLPYKYSLQYVESIHTLDLCIRFFRTFSHSLYLTKVLHCYTAKDKSVTLLENLDKKVILDDKVGFRL